MNSNKFNFITNESGQSPKEIEANIIQRYEKITNTTLYPADPVRLFLESLAYTIAVQNACIDYASKMNLLAYAEGEHLDHLGALLGVYRKAEKPALTTLEFSIKEELLFDVVIPKGVRVTTKSNDVVFTTLETKEIIKGETTVQILAECTQGNEKANGLVVGQICEIVDPLPYITKVANREDVTNGDQKEEDESLRERIRLAPETFTVAGSIESYIAQTKNASAEISAVTATSPVPGEVDIRFVLKGGELPNASMIELVEKHLSADDVRPLTDLVKVSAPEVVEYSINLTWFLAEERGVEIASIQKNVASAIEDYIKWQNEKPGRDVNPSELIRKIMQAGAKRVEVIAPLFAKILPTQIAKNQREMEIHFGGVELE